MLRIDSLQDIDRGLQALLQLDARLPAIHARIAAVPLRRSEPGFASLASIIVGQQVSTASAAAIWGRFRQLVDPLTPENYLHCGGEVWRQIGLSRPKQAALVAASEAVLDGRLDLLHLCDAGAEEAIAALTKIHGIGPWTAEVYLLFAAGHPDIFPAGDVALQIAVQHAFELESRPDIKSLRSMAAAWSPWRGVAARLFWAYYAVLKGRDGVPSL